MKKYRKKPLVIEAIQYIPMFNDKEVINFCGMQEEKIPTSARTYRIRTMGGDLCVSPGDWIIKGVSGEFYPCKPDIFEKTYELVEEPNQ